MPSPQRIAILFAVPQELAPAARLLLPGAPPRPQLRGLAGLHGTLGKKEMLLLAGGMGQKRAGAAAEAILEDWKPDLLVMAGVGGALAADLQVADVVVANCITTGGVQLVPPVIPQLTAGSHRTGPLLSLDHVLVTAQDKRTALASHAQHPTPNTQHPPPLAVEMESHAVARAAIRHGVSWAAVRAVSDTAEESLPLDFNRLRTPDGDLPTSRVALAAITQPRVIPGLIRLGKNTTLAAEALARYLERWLNE